MTLAGMRRSKDTDDVGEFVRGGDTKPLRHDPVMHRTQVRSGDTVVRSEAAIELLRKAANCMEKRKS